MPSSELLAPRWSIAQMPMKRHTDEKASALEKETASTGRSGRSTSSPQMRRKRRAGRLTAAWYVPRGLVFGRRLSGLAQQLSDVAKAPRQSRRAVRREVYDGDGRQRDP